MQDDQHVANSRFPTIRRAIRPRMMTRPMPAIPVRPKSPTTASPRPRFPGTGAPGARRFFRWCECRGSIIDG